MNQKKSKERNEIFKIMQGKEKKQQHKESKDKSSKFSSLVGYTYSKYKKEGGILSKPTFLKYRMIQILDNEQEKNRILSFLNDIFHADFTIKNPHILLYKGLSTLVIKQGKELLGIFDYKKVWSRVEQEKNKAYLCFYEYDIESWEKEWNRITQLGIRNGFPGYFSWEEFKKNHPLKNGSHGGFQHKEDLDRFIIQNIKEKGMCGTYHVKLEPFRPPLKLELSSA